LVPIRFRIADVGEHYNVPRLLGLYDYSMYRGS
jgi:5-hydroxyisourate hydrolase-like protein (transthyretin family)